MKALPEEKLSADFLQLAPCVDWQDMGKSEHFVQFYENDSFLVESVAGFISTGLRNHENAVVIATQAHRDALDEELKKKGLDLAAMRLNCQYFSLDAKETLSKFMVNGLPDEKLFRQTVGSVVARATQNGAGLRAFGEMVALLCAEGNSDGAISLETLWNDLAKNYSFSLFCAYPLEGFAGDAHGQPFLHICKEHSRVIPSESYVGEPSVDERLRAITLLQQQAVSLRAEVIERKRNEQAAQHLVAIVKSSEDAILSKDLNGIIMSWNEGAQRLFGYTAEEMIGKPVLVLIPNDHKDEEPRILDRIRRGERIEHYETVRQRKDGSLIDISLTVSPIKDSTGKIVGASKIARDITDRKKNEKELRQAREQLARANEALELRVAERTASLQEALAQMEEFSYSVSHDLRAPLRAMQGYCHILLEEAVSELSADNLIYLKRIGQSAERLDRLVQDVLAFTRVSRAEIVTEAVDLDHLVAEVLQNYADEHLPRPEVSVQKPLLGVLGHEPSLVQCVSNLITNALKFVPQGTTPRLRIWTQRLEGNVRLWIEDNGIGIHSIDQEKIFKMFERSPDVSGYPGTGVGLAIAKKAIDRMHGQIGVESMPGKGSQFWIQLPGLKSI